MFKAKKTSGCFIWRLIKLLLKIAFIGFAVLFTVFFFDLDGKLLYYVVEPVLVKHYDKMERKDVLSQPYDTGKYSKVEYDV